MANQYLEPFPPEGEKKLEEVLPKEAANPQKEEVQTKFIGHVPLDKKRVTSSVRGTYGPRRAPRK